MQSQADKVAEHLERAVTLLKMAEELSATDREAAEKLRQIAKIYQRIAENLRSGIDHRQE